MSFKDLKFFHELAGNYTDIDGMVAYSILNMLENKLIITKNSSFILVYKDHALISKKARILLELKENDNIEIDSINKFFSKASIICDYLKKYPSKIINS
jgi:hypothetical protein